jgi:ubiquinol-cytochrome c reductase cytochrome c1 subunit
MKRLIASLCLIAGTLLGGAAHAAGAQVHLDTWPEARGRDLASLQNGARTFVNYCMGCHSANLMRWNRLNAIGLDDRQIRDFLIFGEQKVGDPMTIAMRPADAKAWFGKMPPDMSVIARARTSFDFKGTDYLYTLLRGYYRDATSPTGWNNVAYPNIGMPHILWERQGPREATIERIVHDAGGKGMVREVAVYDAAGRATVTRTAVQGHAAEGASYSFKPADPALARQYDSDVADLVAFLTFMTDPSATTRVRIGVWVLLFLAFFTVVAWWLNREYWKDVK